MTFEWPAILLLMIIAVLLWPVIHDWLRRRARITQDRQNFERLKNAARREQ